ncbi:MAG: hypothetical protein HY533_05665 [Chloroflexi bacterium]|nr:hypothetical protein [Chloroflexota bacterium]
MIRLYDGYPLRIHNLWLLTMERGWYAISGTLRESAGFGVRERPRAVEGVLLAKKAVVFAGKMVGAALLFLAALAPVQLGGLEILFGEPPADQWWDLAALTTVLCLISLPCWMVCNWRKALVWVVIPLFTGGLASLPFWFIGWVVGQLGD